MIEIKKVESKRELKRFMQFRYDLYRDDPNDVPYFWLDEEGTLRPDKNASFEDCEAVYYKAFRGERVVGRIAGIINHKANRYWNAEVVRFGWFDFVDDYEVSHKLLEEVRQWGKSKGMVQMVGPMGFSDTDREGMLVSGFDTLGTMYAYHNYAYYPKHIESFGGFEKDNDYVQFLVKVPTVVPDRFAKVAAMVKERYHLQVRHLTRKQLIREGYGREVFRLLNATYKNLYGFAELSERKVDQLVEQYIKIADINLVCTVYDEKAGKMVGFAVTFPSISEALRKTHDGKLLPFGWWHLVKAIYWKHADTVDMLLIGVLPEYRSKGANALIFNELVQQYQRYGFKWAQSMPMMETNNHILSNWDYFEATENKRLRCYRRPI
ncbi:MAG: N-acetyltransferase [Prevotella sp.]|nr:N-acetyltransferase [Prevotella sp.]